MGQLARKRKRQWKIMGRFQLLAYLQANNGLVNEINKEYEIFNNLVAHKFHKKSIWWDEFLREERRIYFSWNFDIALTVTTWKYNKVINTIRSCQNHTCFVRKLRCLIAASGARWSWPSNADYPRGTIFTFANFNMNRLISSGAVSSRMKLSSTLYFTQLKPFFSQMIGIFYTSFSSSYNAQKWK